jgi:hypothetical protein
MRKSIQLYPVRFSKATIPLSSPSRMRYEPKANISEFQHSIIGANSDTPKNLYILSRLLKFRNVKLRSYIFVIYPVQFHYYAILN